MRTNKCGKHTPHFKKAEIYGSPYVPKLFSLSYFYLCYYYTDSLDFTQLQFIIQYIV